MVAKTWCGRPHIGGAWHVYPVMSTRPPFEEIVQQHGSTVLRVCRALLAQGEADDAWSETFLAALRAYPDLDPQVDLTGWLVMTAHRKAVDVLRARRRRATPVGDVPEALLTSPGPEPADEVLWGAVRRLPPKQQSAVVLHHLGGLPYGEVAAQLGGTPAAARRAAADGIATLRRQHPALGRRPASDPTTPPQRSDRDGPA